MLTKAALGFVAGALATAAFAQGNPNPSRHSPPRSRVSDHDGKPWLPTGHRQSQRALLQRPHQECGKVNLATNYFAIGHPSLTNYLEVVGGSNFGVRSDHAPNWGSTCSPNIATGIVNADNNGKSAPVAVDTGNVCPISGTGTDAETPAVDTWNETDGPFVALADIDGVKSVPAAHTVGETIADQLDDHRMGWKSYQESLPLGSIYGVNYSNGTATNLSDFSKLAPLTSSSVVQLYAVKHNPFAYFASIQDGNDRDSSLANTVGFDGPTRPLCRSQERRCSGLRLHRTEPVRRPAWPRQRRRLLRLRLRPERQRIYLRHAGRDSIPASSSRATSPSSASSRRSMRLRRGSRAATQS